MKVPLSWLRDFVDVRVEPRKLGDDLTMAGLALEGLEKDGTDAVLDLDVTTNRVDCMNVYGVAREVSVIYGLPLRPLEAGLSEAGPPAASALEVAIEAPDLCPRFCARVLDVRLGPSPAWVRDRLEAVGVRPINNVVDLTNYVMMEMGHPSHAFDLDCIPQGRLHVRWAREGEKLTTLDGIVRTLSPRTGVVAGPREPLALAGIMGGASSEVSEKTRTVALEAAYWEPLAIRRAAKALGMHTEASHRFERGADPEAPVLATARVAHLLTKIGAGSARPGLVDRVAAPLGARRASLRASRLRELLGADVTEERARTILAGLGFRAEGGEAGASRYEVPSWRGDVAREADLVEEVARHFGLGRIPSTLPPARVFAGLKPAQQRERALRMALVGAGLTEVVSYAFVAGAAAPGAAVRLDNPIAADQDVLRDSLVMPGLVTTLQTNLRQGRREVAVFEIGRVFAPGEGLPVEERRLGVLIAGPARPGHWSEKAREADFFDLKGILEAVGRRLGARLEVSAGAGLPAFLHPGQATAVSIEGVRAGYAGVLHPDAARALDLKDRTLVAEVALDGLLEASPPPVRFRPLPRFPAVSRDLSVVSDLAVPAAELEAEIRKAGGEELRSVSIVDRYQGPPVPEGKVSITVSLRYQDPSRTLTSEEVGASVEAIVRALRARGAEIRGE